MLILDDDADDDLILDADAPPQTPTLSITPNGDGSGAVATIGDTAAGSLNTLTVYQWIGAQALPQSEFTRTGDGTIALSLDPGAYWAIVSTLVLGSFEATSAPVLFWVSAEDVDAVYWRILQAVAAKLQATAMPVFEAADVAIRRAPFYDAKGTTNQIAVCAAPESFENKYNATNEKIYTVLLGFMRPTDGARDESGLADMLRAREIVEKAFEITPDYFPIPDVSEVYRIDIVPGAVFNPEAIDKGFDVGAIFLRCYSRELRTGV